jgi:hypothetical protein
VAIPLAVAARWLWLAWPRYRPLLAVTVVLALSWLAWSNVHYYFFEAFDSYVLGGRNTQVATAIAHYLNQQDPAPKVYFFGQPRMGYRSLATIPYLAPQVPAEDVSQPLQAAPAWRLTSATVFLFLPEREDELSLVRAGYPGGAMRQVGDDAGQPLFLAYEVAAPTRAGQ